MEVQNNRNDKNGVFYIEENGKQVAAMTYIFAGDTKFIIDHTEVQPGNEGKGLGRKLVQAGVDYAREHDLKILPLCTYAKSVFDKTSEYSDVRFV